MLNWQEVKEALAEAMEIGPNEFEKQIADTMPQDVFNHLIDEYVEAVLRKFPSIPFDTACTIASFGMTGFQMGWMLAMRVRDESRT